jgi:hypothetical protein
MLDLAWFAGQERTGKAPAWTVVGAQVKNALKPKPKLSRFDLSNGIVTYTGTASQLMGACDDDAQDPTQGVQNGFACNRSTDVWGVALDNECRVTVSWPVAPANFNDADPANAGTWVSTQSDGTTLCKRRR